MRRRSSSPRPTGQDIVIPGPHPGRGRTREWGARTTSTRALRPLRECTRGARLPGRSRPRTSVTGAYARLHRDAPARGLRLLRTKGGRPPSTARSSSAAGGRTTPAADTSGGYTHGRHGDRERPPAPGGGRRLLSARNRGIHVRLPARRLSPGARRPDHEHRWASRHGSAAILRSPVLSRGRGMALNVPGTDSEWHGYFQAARGAARDPQVRGLPATPLSAVRAAPGAPRWPGRGPR